MILNTDTIKDAAQIVDIVSEFIPTNEGSLPRMCPFIYDRIPRKELNWSIIQILFWMQ